MFADEIAFPARKDRELCLFDFRESWREVHGKRKFVFIDFERLHCLISSQTWFFFFLQFKSDEKKQIRDVSGINFRVRSENLCYFDSSVVFDVQLNSHFRISHRLHNL